MIIIGYCIYVIYTVMIIISYVIFVFITGKESPAAILFIYRTIPKHVSHPSSIDNNSICGKTSSNTKNNRSYLMRFESIYFCNHWPPSMILSISLSPIATAMSMAELPDLLIE